MHSVSKSCCICSDGIWSGCSACSFCIGGTLSLVICWIFTGTHVGTGLVRLYHTMTVTLIYCMRSRLIISERINWNRQSMSIRYKSALTLHHWSSYLHWMHNGRMSISWWLFLCWKSAFGLVWPRPLTSDLENLWGVTSCKIGVNRQMDSEQTDYGQLVGWPENNTLCLPVGLLLLVEVEEKNTSLLSPPRRPLQNRWQVHKVSLVVTVCGMGRFWAWCTSP